MFDRKSDETFNDQVKRIASYMNKLGLANIKDDDLMILKDCLDKNKDGKFCFQDFVA